jgi:uncharacterized protein
MKYLGRRAAFLTIVLLISTLVLVYPPLRLMGWLLPELSLSLEYALILLALPISLRLVHERTNQAWSRAVSAVVMTWLGICFVMLTLLVPAEFLALTGWLTTQQLGIAVCACAGSLALYGIYNARSLHVRTVTVSGPESAQGKRLVQISDVHIGSRQPGLLRPIVEKINALNADYTLITGDLIDMHNISEASLAPLGDINNPTLFCIGNHERYVDLEAICRRLNNLGIEVLRNASVVKNDLQFIGIDDAERKDQVARELVKFTPAENTFKVLLYHRPDGCEAAADWGADLMLTGHTHRGQIFPFNFLVKKVFPRLYQSYEVGNMHLYVSPGTGTWGPVMRLGSKCEITLFQLL